MAEERRAAQPDETEAALALIRAVRRRVRAISDGESCDFCGETLGRDHGHVLGLLDRRLRCACRACYLLFLPRGAGRGRFCAVPQRYRAVRDSTLVQEWTGVICGPVQLAFAFLHSGTGRITVCYPSPQGLAESFLPDGVPIVSALRSLLQPDVEALLCWRRAVGAVTFLVPIDVCYELVARLRLPSNRTDLDALLEEFFDRLHSRCEE